MTGKAMNSKFVHYWVVFCTAGTFASLFWGLFYLATGFLSSALIALVTQKD